MAAMLGNSVVVVVRTRPRAIPLAMIIIRKSTHGFPFLSHDAYGAPLGGPSGRRSSAIKATVFFHMFNRAVKCTSSCFIFHPLKYSSIPHLLLNSCWLWQPKIFPLKAQMSHKGLPQLDCQYKSIDKYNLRLCETQNLHSEWEHSC